MSLFEFGNFEKEIDFTDADFLDILDEAYAKIQEDAKHLPVTGKNSDIIRAQNACYDGFFDCILGDGASEKMFETNSLSKRIDAVEMLAELREKEDENFSTRLDGYQVKKPVNREQRRNRQKKYNHNRR